MNVCATLALSISVLAPDATAQRHDEDWWTPDALAAAGFIPGRRVEFLDEMWPREVLEFQRPRS